MNDIKKDPAVQNLLNRMPKKIQDTFTDEQLVQLKIAIGARQWGNHAIDCRGVLGFFKYRYYFVFLAGRNRRNLSKEEKRLASLLQTIVVTIFAMIFFVIALIILYLIKSALGINLLDDYSFGIWDWFKSLFK